MIFFNLFFLAEIRVWNLSFRETVFNIREAHSGFVRGLSIHWQGDTFLSCGDDKKILLWSLGKPSSELGVFQGSKNEKRSFTFGNFL